MNISVDQLGQELVSHGLKLTAPRRAVLDVVAEMRESLSPAEIYERGQQRYPRLGLVTVYRTLSLLVELGYLQRLHLDGGCHCYAVVAQPNSHHLHCSVCGRVEAFPCGEIEPLIATLQAQTGYAIDAHMLELMGRCPDCQDKDSAKGD